MLKKSSSIIIIVLLALLLMAVVIWIFNKRIENIEMKNKVNHSLLYRYEFYRQNIITI